MKYTPLYSRVMKMRMAEFQLQKILADCVSQQEDSFRALYDFLQPKIFSYVTFRVTGHEQALDCTQDIFVELHSSIRTFVYHSDGEFYSFVFTIVRRILARHYANKHTQALKDKIDIVEDVLPGGMEVSIDNISVQSALRKLDELNQEIIVLHHWSRYTFGEIAGMLNMKESAVRTRHHRALATLSTILAY